jgi:hypothetical protein
MIWISFLIIAFLALGLGRRASAGRRHLLVVVVSTVTLGVMYLTFGNG